MHLSGGAGFDLTEVGTHKRLAVYVVTDQASVTALAGIARLGPDALALSREALGQLLHGRTERLKTALTDQTLIAGAVTRSLGQDAARLKGEKRAGLAVHARTGLPSPVCGDTVREVSFADRAFQYCPTCQTGGKPLADRRLSRLVR